MTTSETLDFLENRWKQIKARLGTAQWPEFLASYQATVASVPKPPSQEDLDALVESIKQLVVSFPKSANIWWNWERNLIVGGDRGAPTYEEMLQESDGELAVTVETLLNRFEAFCDEYQASLPDSTPPSPETGNTDPSSAPLS